MNLNETTRLHFKGEFKRRAKPSGIGIGISEVGIDDDKLAQSAAPLSGARDVVPLAALV